MAKVMTMMMAMVTTKAMEMTTTGDEGRPDRLDISPLENDTGAKTDRNKTDIHKKMKYGKAKMRRGITLDSGSHHNVMPKRMVEKSSIRPSAGSRRGLMYVAANKWKISNEGEVDFKFETTDGSDESRIFQIAEVNEALASIADRVDNGWRVGFDQDESGRDVSHMLHKKTKRVIKSTRVGNVWVIEAIVRLDEINDEVFARRE